VWFALLLLTAGFGTTSNMIGLGAVALLETPTSSACCATSRVWRSAAKGVVCYLAVCQPGDTELPQRRSRLPGRSSVPGGGVVIALDIANRDPAQFAEGASRMRR
jgi:hypothetical protein